MARERIAKSLKYDRFEAVSCHVMTYVMTKKTIFQYPTEKYLNTIKQGYKDCGLEMKFLIKALNEKK